MLNIIPKVKKLISETIEVRGEQSFLVKTYEEAIGSTTKTETLVNKAYFQPRIDKLQNELDKFQSLQNAVFEPTE